MPLPGKYILPLFFLTVFLGAIILGPLLYFGLAAAWPIPFPAPASAPNTPE